MSKKKQAKKRILCALAFLLAAVIWIAAVLFFPLKGEKHIQVWSSSQEFDINAIQTVEKSPGEDFKILVFVDTQLWINPVDNKACYEQMRALVEKTQPDMLATVGDNISGVTSRFLIKNFIEVMDSFELPWTVVFGNHDNEIPMTTLNWQGDQFLKSEYCLFQKGPSNLYGCGNYAVNITENGSPVYTLFMLDNGRYTEYDDGATKEIYMGYEQIAWYEWTVNGIANAAGRVVPSMTFSHFAQPEFKEAIEKYAVYNEGDGSYTVPEEYGLGYCKYLPGCAPVKSGFFQKCKALGTTHMICGHDHENNAVITYDGITMAYGMKTGPSPAPWNFAEETGGTLISVSGTGEDQTVDIEHIVIS